MPEATLRAFADHGQARRVLSDNTAAADATLGEAGRAGVDLAALTAQLEREGVQSFCASYQQLLERIRTKAEHPILTS